MHEATPPSVNTWESAEAAIEAGYTRYFQGLRYKDLAAMMAVMAPDFSLMLLDGQILDFGQTKALLEEQLHTLVEVEEATFQITDVAVRDDTATVLLRENVVLLTAGATGQQERAVAVETYRDTWIATADGWKFQRAELLTAQ